MASPTGVDSPLQGQRGSSAHPRGGGGTGQQWEPSPGVTASPGDILPVSHVSQRVCETPLRQSLK